MMKYKEYADDDMTYHLLAALLISIGENPLGHLGSSEPSNVGDAWHDSDDDDDHDDTSNDGGADDDGALIIIICHQIHFHPQPIYQTSLIYKMSLSYP